MHYKDGIYRENFMRFVSAFYAGNVHEGSLGETIHVEGAGTPAESLATLDKEFKAYMDQLGSRSSKKRERLRS